MSLRQLCSTASPTVVLLLAHAAASADAQAHDDTQTRNLATVRARFNSRADGTGSPCTPRPPSPEGGR